MGVAVRTSTVKDHVPVDAVAFRFGDASFLAFLQRKIFFGPVIIPTEAAIARIICQFAPKFPLGVFEKLVLIEVGAATIFADKAIKVPLNCSSWWRRR